LELTEINIERQCFRMMVSEELTVSFELVEAIRGWGYVIQKMSLTAQGGGKAVLVVFMDMDESSLPVLLVALKKHPLVQELTYENEFNKLKTMVKAFDEE